MKRFATCLSLALLFAAAAYAAPSTPQFITLQGYLSELVGTERVPVDGPTSMTFEIYDSTFPDATPLGSIGPILVDVSNGIYSAELPLAVGIFAGADRYIQITVEGEVLAPRTRMGNSPFTYVAERLQGADVFDLEESAEITSAIAAHSGHPAAHPSLEESSEIDSDIVAHSASADPHAVYLKETGGTMTGKLVFANADSAHMTMYAAGTTNGEKPVIAHSPAFPDWGLRYRDSDDTFIFQSSTTQALAVSLGLGRVGIGTDQPQALLDVNGQARTRSITILGGSDFAEPFEVDGGGVPVQPGMLVSIDPDDPGRLRLADRAYDPTVAGVISGAGGIAPGLTMRQEGTIADGSVPVALSGRAYAMADATNGPIRPGDMLTTSDVPGYAMRATDRDRAQGSVIGKAMGSLESGRGLVFVLISLQ